MTTKTHEDHMYQLLVQPLLRESRKKRKKNKKEKRRTDPRHKVETQKQKLLTTFRQKTCSLLINIGKTETERERDKEMEGVNV